MSIQPLLFECENPHCRAQVRNRIHVDALGHICGTCFHNLPAAREQFTAPVIKIETLQRAKRAKPRHPLLRWWRR